MEHPLITDAENLTIEELQTRISDLQRKLTWVQRNNVALAQQVCMALETYVNQYQERQREIWKKSQSSGTDYSHNIDIS